MKALIALTVLAAAAMPAWADSDPVFPMDALSSTGCRPTAIGTVTSVHTDPRVFGTDIVLGDILPSPVAKPLIHDGMIMALIPADNVKPFTALNTYVGQRVAIWGRVVSGVGGRNPVLQITSPLQLELLSTALADPKKTWCYLSPVQREAAALPAAATVRPEIAQALQDAHRFVQGMSTPPNTFAAMKKIKTAEAMPNQTVEEKQAVARVKAFVTGANSNNWGCNICDMAPSGVPDFGPAGGPVTDAPAH